MTKAKKAGKFRYAGITTHTNEPEVIHAAVDTKFYEVVLTAYNYQQKHVAEVRDAIARASQAGLGVVGMKAIRGGYRQTPSVKSSAAALKWVLQDPHVHTIVPGFTTFDQLEVDLAVEKYAVITLNQNVTVTLANAIEGEIYTLLLMQGNTGGMTVSWNPVATYKWIANVAPAITATSLRGDCIQLLYVGGGVFMEINRTTNIAA